MMDSWQHICELYVLLKTIFQRSWVPFFCKGNSVSLMLIAPLSNIPSCKYQFPIILNTIGRKIHLRIQHFTSWGVADTLSWYFVVPPLFLILPYSPSGSKWRSQLELFFSNPCLSLVKIQVSYLKIITQLS